MAQSQLKLPITVSSTLKNGIILPQRVAYTLGMAPSEHVRLSVGSMLWEIPLLVTPPRAGHSSVAMGKETAQKFGLPLPRRMYVRWDTDMNALKVGPVIAIFACTRTKVKRSRRALFGVRTLDMKLLLAHARKIGALAFVLTPEGVVASDQPVTGYARHKKKWIKRTFPVPDVVYDRVQSRNWEHRESTQRARAVLKSNPMLKLFNDGFFDKWTLHVKMTESPKISPYLPHTEQITDRDALNRFLKQHRSIYIKPSAGSLGRGVTRIRRVGSGYQWKTGRRTGHIRNFDALYRRVNERVSGRSYIMQQDLYLATVAGSPFDVRILLQKNGEGKWMRTKTYARIAAKGRIAANLTRGGTGVGLGGVLRARFGKSRQRLRRHIVQAAREIAQGLDVLFDHGLGEIGLDLGVSRTGRVWLIEVNSKPFRKVIDAGPKIAVFRSFRRPMAYSRHLAGF